MRDVIFCIPQVKTRPIIWGSDKNVMQEWNEITRNTEKQFLACQQDYCQQMADKYKINVENAMSHLRKEMSREQAITIVASWVRASEYSKRNARWAQWTSVLLFIFCFYLNQPNQFTNIKLNFICFIQIFVCN